jgi:mono/diheme cytochrome c family protein
MSWLVNAGARGTAVAGAALLAAVITIVQPTEAHKAITSKYTYNDDVFPIFRDRCAQCHVENGVAPMSLTTYKDAYPWAESIRAELVAGHMPPWNAADGFGELKHARTLTARELDVVLTWATGGNPQGDLEQKLPAVTLENEWTLGLPDLALPIPSELTVPADALETTHEVTIATGLTEPRWVRAVDLLPGTPKIVRSAIVSVKAAGSGDPSTGSGSSRAESRDEGTGSLAPDRVLAMWLPGHEQEAGEAPAAFRLPAGAELIVKIHYKKTWQFEGQAIGDRSTVGLYFLRDQQAQQLLAVPVRSEGGAPGQNQKMTFSRTIDADVQALAVRPEQLPPDISVQVEAVRPDGGRAAIIRLNTRPDWQRRYWLAQPLALPRGSRIEVTANMANPDILSEAFGPIAPKAASSPSPIELAIDVVPR